jgi:hypothetical protein
MAHGKSVVVSMEITIAGSSHNCRFNDAHRIKKGDSRLTIKEDRSKLNYCLLCAKKFLGNGLERLHEMEAEVDRLLAAGPGSTGVTK